MTRWLGPGKVLRRLPFTLAAAVILVAVQVSATDGGHVVSTMRRFGTNWSSLSGFHLWRFVTALFVEDQPHLRWSILVPLIWVGIAEWHLGWHRVVPTFFLTDWISTVSVLIGLHAVSGTSAWARAEASRYDVGTSAAIYGVMAMFCGSRRGPNAWIGGALVVQSLATLWLTNRRVMDVQHLLAAVVGLGLGVWFTRRSRVAGATT